MGLAAASRRTCRAIICAPLLWALAIGQPAATARTMHTNGGIGVSGGGAASGTATGTPQTVGGTLQAVNRAVPEQLHGSVTASGNGMTLRIAAMGVWRHPLAIAGTAPSSRSGVTVLIEASPATRASNWIPVATAVISPTGGFATVWSPTIKGEVSLRAVLGAEVGAAGSTSGGSGLPATGAATTASDLVTTPTLQIPIFRNARATFYGPGFWGHLTACGERLRPQMLGVASRTLKCGTRVTIFFRGRELTVPVIDRGPFANHARWDLTAATATALGISKTVVIGTLSPASLSPTSVSS